MKNQISNEEFNSKSEAVNYLIKQARDAYDDYVRMKLERGKKSDFAKKQTEEELLVEIKKNLNLV